MLKTLTVALLAVGMSVGLAQAKVHKQRIAACGEGKQATATCACGIGAGGKPLLCQKGQWCHGWWIRACTP